MHKCEIIIQEENYYIIALDHIFMNVSYMYHM